MVKLNDYRQGVVKHLRFNNARSVNIPFVGSSKLAGICTLRIGGASSYRKVAQLLPVNFDCLFCLHPSLLLLVLLLLAPRALREGFSLQALSRCPGWL